MKSEYLPSITTNFTVHLIITQRASLLNAQQM